MSEFFHDFALKENDVGPDEQYFQRHYVHTLFHIWLSLEISGYASITADDHQFRLLGKKRTMNAQVWTGQSLVLTA